MVVGLAVVALCILDRSAHWLLQLRPVLGLAWTLLLVLPWFIAIVGRAGESFIADSVGRDLLGKIFGGQESHGAPPGYYLLLFWVTFWPAAPLAALAAPAAWRQRREPETKFLLAWLVPSWIIFELVLTKLPHYVLPLYPAIAILAARAIEHGLLWRGKRLVRVVTHWPFIPAALIAIGIFGLVLLRKQLGLLAWPFAGAAIVFGFFAWRFYEADGAEQSFWRAAFASLLMSIALAGVVLPLSRPLFPSAWLASSLGGNCANPQYASAGYHEPSLVFLLGTGTRLTDGYGAAEFLREGGCRFAIVEARQTRAFVQRAEAIGLRYGQVLRIDAINYNIGRWLAISVYAPQDRS
jgi:4-amino-4-deoxy-L-arabinose transferase-like glycosyltransferase